MNVITSFFTVLVLAGTLSFTNTYTPTNKEVATQPPVSQDEGVGGETEEQVIVAPAPGCIDCYTQVRR
ncbi:MAG TPA: hypothetical protein VF666_13855 [Pyrinomonadaceae bacterium]|jgi:hypothetical protein